MKRWGLVGVVLLAGVAHAESVDGGLVAPTLVRDSLAQPVGMAGDVELSVSIDAQGEVLEAHVIRSPDPRLSLSALNAVGAMLFSPALQDGRPVAVEIGFTYHFAAPPVPVVVARLEGEVVSRGNRKPIAGAELVVDPTLDGGVTAVAGPGGRFAVDLTPGLHEIVVQAGGFQPQTFHETLGEVQKLEVRYRLNPTGTSPFQTIIHAPSERTEVSRITLTGAEMTDVAGTMGDPLRVVMLLPGVGSVVSGIAYPVVRGSDPADTGYYIDGIPIPILFHLLLGPEVISPDFIDAVDFYPSNPPIDEGRHLTGAVSVTSKAPRDDGAHVTAYADLINAGVFGEVAFPQTGTSISVAGRTSYTGWLSQLIANTLESPGSPAVVLEFADYQARIDQKLGGGHLRLFVFGSTDNAGAGATPYSAAEIATIQFFRADLRYQHPLAGGQGEVGVTYGDDGIGESSAFTLSEKSVRLRASWKRDFGPNLHALVGMDADYRHADLNSDQLSFNDQGFMGVGDAEGSFSGAYAELTWRPTPRWSVTPGFRIDNYFRAPNIDELALEPRLTARYQLREGLFLKGGVGLAHEPPVLLIDLPAVDLGALGYGLQEGLQTEVGEEWTFWRGNQLNLTAYFNPLFRTVELGIPGQSPLPAQTPDQLDPVTKGLAFGFEMLLRHPLGGNWFGWLSCAVEWSLRYETYALLDANGNPLGTTASGYLPFAFDQTFIANAALTYRFPRGWSAGTVLHFNTGRPESGVLGSYTQAQGTQNGEPAWVPVQLNQVNRLPPFYRVDLQVSKTWTFDLVTVEAYFDLLNATIDWETLGYDYGSTSTGGPGGPTGTTLTKMPISIPIVVPMLGLRGTY